MPIEEFTGELDAPLVTEFTGETDQEKEARAKRSGFLPTIARTSGQMLHGAGTALEDVVGENVVSRKLSETGKGIAEKYPAGINSLADIAESPWLTVKEAVGQMVPQIGVGMLGRIAGGAAGGALAGPPGAIVGGIAGGLAPILAQEYAGIRDEQKEPGGTENKLRALTYALGATGLEMLGPEGRIINKGLKAPARVAGESLAKAVAKRAAKDVAIEGVTEGLQTGVEKVGAYKDPLAPANLEEAAVASIMGGIGGGVVGGAHRALQGQEPAPKLNPQEELLHKVSEAVITKARADELISQPPIKEPQNDQQKPNPAADQDAAEEEVTQNVPNIGTIVPNIGTPAPTTSVKPPVSAPAETITPKTVGGIPVSALSAEELDGIKRNPDANANTRRAAGEALRDLEQNPEARSGIPLAESPATAKGMTRYYHGGNPESVTGPLWFTSSLQDAQGWASRDPSMKIWYVDVPTDSPLRGGDKEFGVEPPSRIEFPAAIASQRKIANPDTSQVSAIAPINGQNAPENAGIVAQESAAPPSQEPDVQKSTVSTIPEQPAKVGVDHIAGAGKEVEVDKDGTKVDNTGAGVDKVDVSKTTEDLKQGAEVERFQGQYGKGMSERNARAMLPNLAKKKPKLSWSVEKTTVPEFPDRWDVVGRTISETVKSTANAENPAKNPAKMSGSVSETSEATAKPVKAPTSAQPAAPEPTPPAPETRVFYDDAVKAYTATAFDERFGNMHGTGATEELATADLNKRLEAAYRYGTWRSVEHPTQPAPETPAKPSPTIAEMSPADLLRAAADKMDSEAAAKAAPSESANITNMAQDKDAAANKPTPAAAGEFRGVIRKAIVRVSELDDILGIGDTEADSITDSGEVDPIVVAVDASGKIRDIVDGFHRARGFIDGGISEVEAVVIRDPSYDKTDSNLTDEDQRLSDLIAAAATPNGYHGVSQEDALERIYDIANEPPESAAGGDGNLTTKDFDRAIAAGIKAGDREQSSLRKEQVETELQSIRQNGDVDSEDLSRDPKYWNAEDETFTDAGFAEIGRRQEALAAERAESEHPTITELSDLNDAHQFAQRDAMEAILDELGITYNTPTSWSSSRYIEVTMPNEETAKIRFANHANQVRDTSMQADINIAPGEATFTEAIDWIKRFFLAANPSVSATKSPETAPNRSETTTSETKTPADSFQKPNVGTSAEVPPVLSEKEGGISDKNEGETDKGTALFSRATEENANIQLQPNEANREYTEKLQTILKREGHDFTITPATLPVDVVDETTGRVNNEGTGPSNHFALAEKLAGLFGKQVVWIETEGPVSIGGVVNAALPKHIFLNARAINPAHLLVGHELTHHMKYDAPGVYNALSRSITALLRNHAEYRAINELGKEFSDTDVTEEIIGDLMGDSFGKREFWNRVAKQSPSAFRRIANIVRGWLDNLISKIREFGSDRFVTDIHAARKALAQAVVDYAEDRKQHISKEWTDAATENWGRSQFAKSANTARNVQGGAGEITAPDWVKEQPADMQETLRKAGAWKPKQTLQERFAGWTADWQKKLKQGMVDQFDPIKSLNYRAYMLARMTKSAAGPLESALFDGTVFIDKDGAVDVNYEKGGFIGKMQALKGEHDRFFAWVVGNRAARLMEEGREHNFSKEDIARLKTLNRGKMEGGSAREIVYAKALADLNRYNKSILDMAQKAGLIDAESRPFWEKDFYIPFYRMTEGDETKGPIKSGGLVRQYAFKTLKGGEQAIGDPMENILKNWAHLIDASLKNQAAVASLDAAVKVGVAHETTADEKGAVFVMKSGKKTYYGVDDPFVLDAINSLGFSGFSGPAMKVMSSFKRWLTYGVTISPTFRIRNVIRDSISMIGTNPANYNVLDNVLTGWNLTVEDSPSYASMIAGGGVIRFGTLERDGAANVKRLVDAGVEAGTILNSQAKVKAMLKDAYDWWMRVGDRSENVNRAALYQKLRDEGKSHLEASYAARDTMDFSMMGTWSAIRFLAQTVPFFNARLQGMYKLGRGAAEDPRRFAYVVGATALASMALLLAYKDDDDWKQREDFDRESFWWFKIGDKAFRIPKPFEIGALGTLAERGLEAMITDDLTAKQFAQRMGAVVGQQLSMNPVPQLFMPMIETWANKDSFTGRAIETMGMEKLSPSERIGARTSAFAQLAGKNGIVSPVQIDHLINGYFGWLGTHAVATSDLALRPVMGLPEKPAMRIDDVFMLGDFARDLPAYQSKYVTRLYEQGREVQQVMADMRAYQKIGATEKAAEILKDKGDKIRLYRLYTHAEQQLTKINQQIKITQKRTGDADAKRARLDQLYAQRNRIAKLTEDRAQSLQK